MDSNSLFKTPVLEKQYMDVYDAVLNLWNVPHEALDVPTRFGVTHISAAGPKEKPAMVLLPGFGANSTQWFPNVAALSSPFRVYAVDTNGQPGKSLPGSTLTAQDSSDWIAQVLDGLGIEKAILGGISLGGWLSLHFAIREPERVTRLVLLDPAASFEGMSAAFLWHGFIPFMVHPTRAGLVQYFHWMTRGYSVNKEWGELMLLGILNTRPQPPIRASAFSDADLRNMKTPTLLLIGERSVIYNPKRVYRRACRLIPDIQVEIVPNASHALNTEAAEYVNARILQFCLE